MTCSKGLGIFLIILLAYSNILSQQESCHKEVESLHRNINSLKSIKEQPVLEKNISLLYELRKTHTCLNSDYKYNQLLFTYYLSEGTLDSTIKYARIINSIDGVNLTLKANNESKFSDFLYRHLFIDSSYKYAQSALNKYQKLDLHQNVKNLKKNPKTSQMVYKLSLVMFLSIFLGQPVGLRFLPPAL